jgi:hypothetical protein
MKKLLKFADTKAGLVVAAAAVAAVALYVAQKKAREAAGDMGQAINPLNNDNIFSSGVDAVGARLTGDERFSLGVWIYDITHGID